MKESILQNKNLRGPRFWARGILWGICTLLGLAACLVRFYPYYSLWINPDPLSYGWSLLLLVHWCVSIPLLIATAFSALVGRLWLKTCSKFTTAALLVTNITLLFYPMNYLYVYFNIDIEDLYLVIFHISAVISILAIIGLAADSIRLLRRVWKARKTRPETAMQAERSD